MKALEAGQCSTEELRNLLDHFLWLMNEGSTLPQDLKRLSEDRWQELFPKACHWSSLYEFPTLHITFMTLERLGLSNRVVEISRTSVTPKSDAFAFLQSQIDNDIPEGLTVSDLLTYGYPLYKTLVCWLTYGKTLSTLFLDFKNGNDQALFKAVSIDRTLLSCPAVAQRLEKAELCNDQRFYYQLQNALNGRKASTTQAYDPARFLIATLDEFDLFETVSQQERYRLFTAEFDAYPVDDQQDKYDAFNRFVNRWRKSAENFKTKKTDFMS